MQNIIQINQDKYKYNANIIQINQDTYKCKYRYMCLEKQNTYHQDSGLIYQTWRMSLSFLTFLMMIWKL